MTAQDLPFSRAEYARRLEKTRAAMSAAGLDLLFVEDPSNMAWLTGYDGWSFYVHQGVLVFHDRDPLWWGRRMDSKGALHTVWMEAEHVRAYADKYVQSTEFHPMMDLAEIIREAGHGRGRVGVEMENYYFSAKAYITLLAELPEAELVDATALVNWQRGVKSDEEIAFMRKAGGIAERVMDGVIERIEPGMRKNELVAEILRDQVLGNGEDWGDYPAIVPLVPSGPAASAAHLTWNGDPFRSNEATFFELAGCYRRYHVPLCRTVSLGAPSDALLHAEAALVEGLEAGLDAARAGNRACDVANALAAPLERAGIERGARCGYPIGVSYPPDWGERTISFRAEDETLLEPGMSFHFMPGIWMENWGLEITESILIRPEGPAECFCDRPRKLIVKP
ncbi:M24 family metallopeptidase [Tropicimonas sp. TH_r6]|uniref:M24 family metallopeptidase n=1 Tax=Tropicimonas sp. TH_r6 TaxID=3082085 RepID=UPI002954A792|nr:M24 family metallopeptidase [Tropicimonas sp. TH_r6]MDV7145341.1 M24 family metallopeptidase [Tropicimonas sp. TH_r6]